MFSGVQKAVEGVQRVALEALTHGACARSDKERRRGVAKLLRGGETPDQPHNRHVPTDMNGMILQVEGLRWHDPISVVGAASGEKIKLTWVDNKGEGDSLEAAIK